MPTEWMAIEERVPGPSGAVRLHPGGAIRSTLVQSIVAALAEEPAVARHDRPGGYAGLQRPRHNAAGPLL
jgi:hypothetical protein